MVSVVDTDKGKEAIAAGVEINEEKEEIADEDAPLVLVQCVNEAGYKFKNQKLYRSIYNNFNLFRDTYRTRSRRTLEVY